MAAALIRRLLAAFLAVAWPEPRRFAQAPLLLPSYGARIDQTGIARRRAARRPGD